MRKILLSLLGISLFTVAFAQCSMIDVPLATRVSASNLIVEGSVISKNSFWNTSNNMIYTSNLIDVYKIFKGQLTTTQIEIITQGGTVGLNKITAEPTLELNIGETGIFTCEPVSHAKALPVSNSGIPRFEAYASSQGFVKYDLTTQTAHDVFHTYTDIETGLYNSVLSQGMRTYHEVQPFNLHSAMHGGNPTVQSPSISGFSPTTITAGTGTTLTINGSGFGTTQGSGNVGFRNADDGGSTYINPLQTEIVSWSSTQITVKVPSNAGTGTIQVTQGTTSTSAGTLTISYAHLNVDFDPGSGTVAYQTDHINDNGSGGYTWQMNANVSGNALESAAFMRAFDNWRCTTGINWTIGAATSVNDAVSDGTNCICNDNANPLSAGILGVCYSYWSGCASGPTIVWYVNELDIIFDEGSNISPLTWDYGPALPTGSQYDFESVCVHELGHGHQLGHVIASGQIMHYALSNGASNRTLSANDIAGGNFVQAKSVVANVCGPGAMTNHSCGTPPVADFSGTPTTLCAGGTVNFTDLSTNTPTSWSWTFQGGTPATSTSQNPSVVFSTAGTYSVSLTATNASGNNTHSVVGYIHVNANPTASGVVTNISCNASADGAINLTPAGGSPSYTFAWSPSGQTTEDRTNLGPATYSVTVTDANGCTSLTSYVVTQPSVLNAVAASQTNISCNGGSNGAASVSVSGGTTAYSFNWTPGNPTGDGTASVTGLTVGTWTCTVTDAHSCVDTQTFNITAPSAISLTAASQTNISCNGGSNGAASVNVATGGTPGYTYNWTPGNPTGDGTISVAGLTAGTWTCTVTDANSCTQTRSFTITAPSAISIPQSFQSDIACHGGNEGAASVMPASGGTPGYTYNWTPGNPSGDGTPDVTNLTAGTYTCTVTDANSCTSSTTFNIAENAQLVLSPVSQLNVSCNGGSDGLASVSLTGGVFNYTYDWTPGNPTGDGGQVASNLAVGTWTCTVTDGLGCTANATFSITQPTALSVTMSETDENCSFGDGTATATSSGGTSPYIYSWSPGGQISQVANNLSAATYSCTVTDNNGCTTNGSVAVGNTCGGSAPVANFMGTPTTLCAGSSVDFTDLSTNTPTSWSWTFQGGTPSTSSSQFPTVVYAVAGTYSVSLTATNAMGSDVHSVVGYIHVNANPTASAVVTNVTCNSAGNGAINLTPAGGTGPYTFLWNPSGQTTEDRTSLSPAGYSVTVTDANNCISNTSYVITQPTAVGIGMSGTNASCSNNNGSATATVSGGTSPYSYSWLPGGETTATINALSAGTYTCNVTDANGCTNSGTFLITMPACGAPQIIPSQCGSTLTALNQNIYCTPVSGATNYQYKFMQGATTITTYVRGNYLTNCDLSVIPVLQYAQTYQVTVRAFVNNAWGSYGISCNVTTPVFPPSSLNVAYCGTTVADLNTSVYCTPVVGATNYEWQFMQGATVVATYLRGNSLTNMICANVPGISYAQTYDIKVRAQEGGVWGPFGVSCQLSTPAFPTTQLSPAFCNGSVTNLSSGLSCVAVVGATDYQWKAVHGTFSSVANRGSSSNSWRMSWNPGTTVSTTYNVSVRAMIGGVWGPFGQVCTLTIGANYRLGQNVEDTEIPAEVLAANPGLYDGNLPVNLTAYPNPFSENIRIETDASSGKLLIYNSFGEIVREMEIESSSAEINLSELPAGIYLIQLKTLNGSATQKVIKQ
jgi:PKD repeat protein